MKLQFSFVLILLSFAMAYGQETAAAKADNIRLQLLEIQGKEESLRAKAQELEEALKPENIERSLAGVGSTRPEDLREARRRQLTIERNGVLAQLKLLETSRLRLETSLAEAEGRAYLESARQMPTTTQALVAQSPSSTGWLVVGAFGLIALALVIGLLVYQRAVKLR